ncbi:adhesion G protein-coupled receptor L4-like [Limulus polyphemus]|uniref:Adhesion G protein-coupled receptor L4-like n=1 Tax=Limulus polyphemus TaxID=6850 RepID=A0ABM1TB26_LIMPO|nr:adhesion G protein-coupled receptor L4-like [Limulus polyphemus]
MFPRKRVTFNLLAVRDYLFFQLNPISGNLTTARNIDRRVGQIYFVMVVAVSQGVVEVSHVHIIVSEFNKYPPKFEKDFYYKELHVNFPVNTSLFRVRAHDADPLAYNSEVFYVLGKDAPRELFELDPVTGLLTLRGRLNQSIDVLLFDVFAEDGGSPLRRTSTQLEIVLKKISEPLDVYTTNATDSSVFVCWSSPGFGHVAGYVIKYSKVIDGNSSSAIVNITSNATSTCSKLEGLAPWTDYEFRVYGWNVNETGLKSNLHRFATRYDYCLLNICQNGDCYVINEAPGYRCECTIGYYGDYCDQFDLCSWNPCENFGICRPTSNKSYTCECPIGFSGQNCTVFNPCALRPSPCENGASCQSSASHTFTCACAPGFYGRTCHDFNACFSSPCHNGGTCHNTSNQFTCQCSLGYGGEHCEVDVNECDSNPCLHGSRCEDGVNRFTCYCTLGYHGDMCEVPAQCPASSEETGKGVVYWNATDHGKLAVTECPYGVLHPESEGYVQRFCHFLTSGLVEWGPTQVKNCRDESFQHAEKITEELMFLTDDPANISPQKLQEATTQIENILNFALDDKKIAQNMLSVVSNILALNESILTEADDNGTTSNRLRNVVDKYTSEVKLEEGKSISLETDNIALKALSWAPGLSTSARNVLKFSTTLSNGSESRNFSEKTNYNEKKKQESLIFVPIEAVKTIEADVIGEVRIKFVAYKNDKFFRSRKPKPKQSYQKVLQTSINDLKLINLTKPLVYIMSAPEERRMQCVYWKQEERMWATDGLVTNRTGNTIVCSSNHMTAFSILLDPTPNNEINSDHQEALSIISYIGCVVSICGLIMTILTYLLFRCLNRDRSGKILLHLCVSMLLMNTAFLVGSQQGMGVAGVDVCVVVAILIHYFLLTSLAWMCVEAVNMYQMLIHVFASTETHFLAKRCFLAWGLPLLIVGIAAGISFEEYGYKNKFCMLSPANPYTYYISYMGPSCIILLVNLTVFVMVTRVLFTPRTNTTPGVQVDRSTYAIVAAQVRGAFTVMTLLGITWVFGALAVGEVKLVFQYVFCIANSLQGFLIFLVRCLQFPEARNAWIQLLETGTFKRYRGVAMPNSSWYTHSNPVRKQSYSLSATDRVLNSTSSTTTSTMVQWNQTPNKGASNSNLPELLNIIKPLTENNLKVNSQSYLPNSTEGIVCPHHSIISLSSAEDSSNTDPFASIGFIDEDDPRNDEKERISGDESGYQSLSPNSKFLCDISPDDTASEVIISDSEASNNMKRCHCKGRSKTSIANHNKVSDDEIARKDVK